MFNDYIGLWVVNDGCIRIEKKIQFYNLCVDFYLYIQFSDYIDYD